MLVAWHVNLSLTEMQSPNWNLSEDHPWAVPDFVPILQLYTGLGTTSRNKSSRQFVEGTILNTSSLHLIGTEQPHGQIWRQYPQSCHKSFQYHPKRLNPSPCHQHAFGEVLKWQKTVLTLYKAFCVCESTLTKLKRETDGFSEMCVCPHADMPLLGSGHHQENYFLMHFQTWLSCVYWPFQWPGALNVGQEVSHSTPKMIISLFLNLRCKRVT